jgi:iron(III) transport system substrate-binding protein
MRLVLHFLLLIIVALVAAPIRAQTTSQPALVEAAKKENKLVWYTSMAIDTSKPLLDAFQKEYPFIKAELVRAGEEQ